MEDNPIIEIKLVPKDTSDFECWTYNTDNITDDEKKEVLMKISEHLGLRCQIREKLLYQLCVRIINSYPSLWEQYSRQIPGLERWWERNKDNPPEEMKGKIEMKELICICLTYTECDGVWTKPYKPQELSQQEKESLLRQISRELKLERHAQYTPNEAEELLKKVCNLIMNDWPVEFGDEAMAIPGLPEWWAKNKPKTERERKLEKIQSIINANSMSCNAGTAEQILEALEKEEG